MVSRSVRFGVLSQKLSNFGQSLGDQKCTISSSFVLRKAGKPLGYGPFSIYVFYKDDLCPSSEDINRLMMTSIIILPYSTSGCTNCQISSIHFQTLSFRHIPKRVDVRQAAGRKIITKSLSQHDEKHVELTALSVVRIGE
jgi:hypothetical protein